MQLYTARIEGARKNMIMANLKVNGKEYLVFGGGVDVSTNKLYRDLYIATIE